ncbi:MAG TPA: flippase, partial [Anaerolineae bacterium]|nr:flippase [Anaerolineae bacterium]
MSVIQRLLSNTFLAFASNLIMKMSSTFLFIFVGRLLGTEAAGTYNLGITYFTVIFGLSAWGLQELLVREVAPRPAESGRYLINYVVMRLFLAGLFYGLLWGGLRWVLPYSADTERVILVLALAIFPEAVFGLLHSLFVAHERMGVPAVAAVVNSLFKLGGGGALLWWGGDLERVAWAVPVGSLLSLVVFVVALPWLWRAVPQAVPARLSWSFSREQLRFTKGFVVIHLFTILDFQADTFLLSLYLNEVAIGWYGAAQTVMLGFWMMPIAIRTALYPVMSRYYLEDRGRLQQLHQKAETYLPMLILPMAAGVALLAEPIILLIFDESFVVGTPALQCMIWAVVLAVMNVPNARLMLVHNKQVVAGWVTGGSMVLNIGLNIWLIPRYGIVGASLARVLATGFLFACLRWYVQRYIWRTSLVQILARPLLAVTVMGLAVWPWREALLVWPVLVGVVVYGG